jgi:hypothetical protein
MPLRTLHAVEQPAVRGTASAGVRAPAPERGATHGARRVSPPWRHAQVLTPGAEHPTGPGLAWGVRAGATSASAGACGHGHALRTNELRSASAGRTLPRSVPDSPWPSPPPRATAERADFHAGAPRRGEPRAASPRGARIGTEARGGRASPRTGAAPSPQHHSRSAAPRRSPQAPAITRSTARWSAVSSRGQVPATSFGSGAPHWGRRPPFRAPGRSISVGSAQGLASPSDHGVTRLSLSGRGRGGRGPSTRSESPVPLGVRCRTAGLGSAQAAIAHRR